LRGAATARRREPGAAAKHALRAVAGSRRIDFGTVLVVIGRVPVGSPLAHVPVHVIQAPGVRFLPADRLGFPRGIVLVPRIASESLGIVAEKESRLRTRPASLLPLGFRRQTVLLAFFRAQPVAKSLGVLPAEADHGVVIVLFPTGVQPGACRIDLENAALA